MVATRHRIQQKADPVQTYWRDIDNYQLLSHEEEVELARRARQGDTGARHKLVTANLRFVVRVARGYAGRGLSLMELISEGNVGLLAAVERFDERRGYKFITYAVWWIRQAILKALVQVGRARRSPMSRINDLRRIERDARALSQELGRIPTFDEVLHSANLNPARAQKALEEARDDVSIDAPFFEGEDRGWEGVLADESRAPDRELDHVLRGDAIRACLAELDERERVVICSYYGLDGYSPMTLEQIGEIVGVTRERVRQLRDGALAKMRCRHGAELADFSQN